MGLITSHKQSDYELLRRRCAELKDAGWKQVAIAEALGLTEGWVSRTLKKYKQEGQTGLIWRKPKGPTARLTNQQLIDLIDELNKGATHHGFDDGLWTRQRIKELIKIRFEVSYDPSQVGRLLKKAGWSLKKQQLRKRL
jgi:transposase